MHSRIHKSSSWNLPVQAKNSAFEPRPWGSSQEESHQLPTQAEQAQAQPNYLEILIRNAQTSRAAQPAEPIQAKLSIGAPGDKYEQEADHVAAQVVQQINTPQPVGQPIQRQDSLEEEEVQTKSLIQRQDSLEEEIQTKSLIQRESVSGEEDELQMKPTQDEAIMGGDASVGLESAIHSARGSGQALDPTLQRQMGQAMGADFSSVKIHTDAQADQLNQSIQAKAFTTGQDIFFRQGAYEPGSRGGQELIAHELTHVVQQNGGAVQRSSLVPDLQADEESTPITCSVKLVPLAGNRGGPSVRKDEVHFSDRSEWSVKWASGVGCVYFDIRKGYASGNAYYNNEANRVGYNSGQMRQWLNGIDPKLGERWAIYWEESKRVRSA